MGVRETLVLFLSCAFLKYSFCDFFLGWGFVFLFFLKFSVGIYFCRFCILIVRSFNFLCCVGGKFYVRWREGERGGIEIGIIEVVGIFWGGLVCLFRCV